MSLALLGAGKALDAGGAPFAPPDLSPLTVWLDAPALGLANAAALAGWNGKTPTSVNFAQGTGGAQPTYATNSINSLATVHFGTGKSMTSASTIADVTTNSQYTVLIVAKVASAAGFGVPLAAGCDAFLSDGDGQNIGWAIANSAGVPYPATYNFDVNYDEVNTATSGAYNTAFQTAYDHDNTNLRVRINGGAAASVASAATQVQTGTLVLGKAHAASLDGDIGELIVYSRLLSDAERQQVESYLRTKWALP